LTLIDCLNGLGLLWGAGAGAVYGWTRFGFWGALGGIPVGATVGCLGTFATLVLLALVVMGVAVSVAWIRGARKAVNELLAGRADDGPSEPNKPGG
jgi:hypothetical protein